MRWRRIHLGRECFIRDAIKRGNKFLTTFCVIFMPYLVFRSTAHQLINVKSYKLTGVAYFYWIGELYLLNLTIYMHIRTQLVIIHKRFRIYKIEYWNSNLILKHLVTPLVVYWLDLISAVKNINECAFTYRYTLIWHAVYGKVINLIGILPKNYTSWIDIFRFILGINDIQYSWRYVLTEINCSTYIHIMSCFHFPGLLSYLMHLWKMSTDVIPNYNLFFVA